MSVLYHDVNFDIALRTFNLLDISGRFRGGSGGSLEPPTETKLFQFHGEIYEKSCNFF